MSIKQSKKAMALGVTASLSYLLTSSSAFAAGFAIRNQSASGAATALASDTVNISDASGMFSNPAIMSELSGNHFSLNLNYTDANISIKDASLTNTYPDPGGVQPHPRQGLASVDDVSDPVLIPSLFGVHQVNEDIHFGWSIVVPWATNTEYDQDWTGRYHGIKTELRTTELTLSGSYRVNEVFNVGLGINIQRAQGEFTSAVDLGLIAQQGVGQVDAISRFEGESWGYGLQLGVLAKPTEDLRIGFSFRSEVTHEAKGDMTFTPTNPNAANLLAALAAQSPSLRNSDSAKLKLTLPAVTSLGAAYLLERFTIYGNITYTAWSSFQEFTPEYNGVRSRTLLDWNDSMFFAIGGEFNFDEALTLRGGLAYDQGVTTDRRRTPRTPDNDRRIVALGAYYQLNENLSFNAAYQKLFVDETRIDLSDQAYPDTASRGNLTANLDIDPHVFVVSGNFIF